MRYARTRTRMYARHWELEDGPGRAGPWQYHLDETIVVGDCGRNMGIEE